MSDVFTNASRVPTADGAPDPYDHEINLVDTTVSETPIEATRTRTDSPTGSWRKIGIARIPTRSSVKKELVKRKYARYQENRYSKTSTVAEDGTHPSKDQASTGTPHNGVSETVDFARRDRGRAKEKYKKEHYRPEVAVDVLYENQRGSFLFGIPLYSHSSLLNFDPSPWVNKDFKDSPVNITNAQVPDPSWEWVWKTWYVDMSYDVDEEGWQYSFAFGRQTPWHGTHPWFHSFVRRRRWLRKRVKKHLHQPGAIKASNLSAAHRLNAEYFTIHPKRDQSPDSARPQSYLSAIPTDVEELPDEIKDIATLLKALRLAAIDREKIDIVKRFVKEASDELAYLGPHIPDITSFLVFQNSRKQLLAFLKKSAEEAQQHRDEHDAEEKPEGNAERERIDNLLAAVAEANKEITGLEYWSDRKHVLKTADPDKEVTQAIASIFDKPAPMPVKDDNPAGDIRGISDEAEVGRDPTLDAAKSVQEHGIMQREAKEERASKGKEPRRESEDDVVEADSPPRLGADQVFISD
ncbi:uncharacterized protein HMPREF1541_01552 [Cyphellophora europaea CBS 101466]|uniref:Peroxin/Ferlin domain-containing protein n=1 Tax=Cyphellophora europaea (strain CBS 101466) TaxID=1220924 RepID=W2S300_CYPE1|nr:uncharacterized protein HMPREF1541_01552 [Cyphellophora europaea CBS 101466]ETN42398.1 hypothetical protein HMPREF1541_01552 [Cyphellophora europaea CBS 101466]